jgi:hypothetical protein
MPGRPRTISSYVRNGWRLYRAVAGALPAAHPLLPAAARPAGCMLSSAVTPPAALAVLRRSRADQAMYRAKQARALSTA